MIKGPQQQQVCSRVELILDHGFFPKSEAEVDERTIEVNELRRLMASATDRQRRASLEDGIEAMEASEVTKKKSSRVRPWSALSTRNLRVMKTIPELKQHVRPLSSKMKSAHDLFQHGKSALSSASSDDSLNFEDEIDRHEVQKVWSSSNGDPRHPVSHVLDPDSSTFWISSGLFPQIIIFQFRRTIALLKVLVYCAGVKTLRFKWRQKNDNNWQAQDLQKSTDDIDDSSEFVFHLPPHNKWDTTHVQLELIDGFYHGFPLVRHVNFVEQPPCSNNSLLQDDNGHDRQILEEENYSDDNGASSSSQQQQHSKKEDGKRVHHHEQRHKKKNIALR